MPSKRPKQTPPVMHDYAFVVVMPDMETYHIEVTAQNRQAAARAIIHAQMSKGLHVHSIRDAK